MSKILDYIMPVTTILASSWLAKTLIPIVITEGKLYLIHRNNVKKLKEIDDWTPYRGDEIIHKLNYKTWFVYAHYEGPQYTCYNVHPNDNLGSGGYSRINLSKSEMILVNSKNRVELRK